MGDRFDGEWLVSEYVYNVAGGFAGIIHQRRVLHRLDDDRLRVTQHCQPGPELAGHPMAGFAGRWVFDLRVEGRNRLYDGPDVTGGGVQWMDGVMTGEGVWPRFGYAFTSYGVLPSPERQITGGVFRVTNRVIAVIVGVAVPAASTTDYPTFAARSMPSKGRWAGLVRTLDIPSGEVAEARMARTLSGAGWCDQTGDRETATRPDERGNRLLTGGEQPGLIAQYGNMTDLHRVTGPGTVENHWMIYDAAPDVLVSLSLLKTHGQLSTVQSAVLHAEEE